MPDWLGRRISEASADQGKGLAGPATDSDMALTLPSGEDPVNVLGKHLSQRREGVEIPNC